jgi:patatin-like phospholipase/acyl hydrolase
MADSYRVLSLDGGGIRGIMSAIWLDHLERELGGKLRNHFDLIAGTSTGALLACAIGAGIPAERLIDLYRNDGRAIFPGAVARRWDRLTRTFSEGFSAPKYSADALEAILQREFQELTFGELTPQPILVTAYNTLTREAVVFKNSTARHQRLRVRDLCRASSAAPTYFPAHVMTVERARSPLIDGGVFANNPTACAIAEGVRIQNEKSAASKRIPVERFVVVSAGTGESTRPIEVDDARSWGALQWAIPIIDVLFDGAADAVHYIASQLLAKDRYFRFQTRLDVAYDDMDDASETNLNGLISTAEGYLGLRETRERMTALATLLKR